MRFHEDEMKLIPIRGFPLISIRIRLNTSRSTHAYPQRELRVLLDVDVCCLNGESVVDLPREPMLSDDQPCCLAWRCVIASSCRTIASVR